MNAQKFIPLLMLFAAVTFSGCGPLDDSELQTPEFETIEETPDSSIVANEEALVAASLRLGTFQRTTAALNLRTGPSTNYSILLTMPLGSKVYVEAGPFNTSWYRVVYKTTRGYAHGAYIAPAPAKLIQKLPTTAKVVALTFDAGSDRGFGSSILDTLKAAGVKASFGITGRWAENNPDLLNRMAAEGHQVFNHTYSHRSFTGYSTGTTPLSYATRVDELKKTETLFANIAGITGKPFFRPPYGDYDSSVLKDVFGLGYDFNLMWSCDSLGWNGLTATQIYNRVINFLTPGAVYLFHVGSDSEDANALKRIIAELKLRGYTFAKVNQYVK